MPEERWQDHVVSFMARYYVTYEVPEEELEENEGEEEDESNA